MRNLYNLLIYITSYGMRLVALFSPKMKLFVEGRKDTYKLLREKISSSNKTIWFHCASLGEFEQGVPIIEEIKKIKPNHKIVISFFSPSGYEIKKNTPLADTVVYLPMDTPSNAKQFIDIVNPSLAFFVKYEFWPNYLLELQKRNIQLLLISGVFRKNQIFFKSYGGFMRKALTAFNHFFVQEENSKALLKEIGFQNCTVSGDTRFDRVSHQLDLDNKLNFAQEFKDDCLCIVCGSTWPEDEAVLLEFINTAPKNVKFIIAPHKIETDKIENLRQKINKKTALHSELKSIDITEEKVLIIDCIGLLSKLYNYAEIAYVGGAMGNTGLHNILEPATFGIPIVIGKNYTDFPEAQELKSLGGLFSIDNSKKAIDIFEKLVEDPKFRIESGLIAEHFVRRNVGATHSIMKYISTNQL